MKKWLNKEITTKTKIWQIILSTLLFSIIISLGSYYLFTDCGDELIRVLKWINEENLYLKLTILFFPLVVIIVGILHIATLVTYGDNKKKRK